MKRLLLVVATTFLATLPLGAQDSVTADPEHYKVEIDNNLVRVVRAKRPAHHKSVVHEHPDYVAVFLTDVHQKITDTDGKTREVNRKAGDVAFNKAVKHVEENLADQPMEVLLVELKPGAKWSPSTSALDPVKVDPKHHKVEIENDRVRVVRSIREPHAEIPMHEHENYIAIAITDVNSMVTLPDGKTNPNQRKAGSVLARTPIKHAVASVGDARIEEIQIDMK